MAWQQQQQQGNYDNYGGYIDPGYGQNDQQHQYYADPSAGMVSRRLHINNFEPIHRLLKGK